jgi:hypothetical protein
VSDMDPREVAAAVGRLAGKESMADDVLSGRLSASEVAPLMAGMVDGVIRQLFIPITGAKLHEPIGPLNDRGAPMHARLQVGDGSWLRVTIAAEDGAR